MKQKSIILISLFLILMLVFSTISFATETKLKNKLKEENVVEDELIENDEQDNENLTSTLDNNDPIQNDSIEFYDNDIYEITDTVNLTKMVNGNVYIIAKEINIKSSIIDGNVYLIAENISIENSTINNSAYILGENIEINSKINDAYIAGENIKIDEKAVIHRNLRVAGDGIDILGTVYDNVYSSSEKMYIGDNAKILGVLEYSAPETAVISPTAVVSSQNYNKIEKNVNKEEMPVDLIQKVIKAFSVFSIMASVVKALIIAGILILFSSKVIEKGKNAETKDYLTNIGKGFGLFILIPIISIILLITIFGAGLGIILLLLYIVLVYISSVIASLVIASNILKDNESKWKLYGLTVLICFALSLIKLVPVAGVLIVFVFKLIGLGFLFGKVEEVKNEEIVTVSEKK